MPNTNDTPPPYSATANMAASTPSVHKIVVGVDFGTTATGISWVDTSGAHVKVLDDVNTINNWYGLCGIRIPCRQLTDTSQAGRKELLQDTITSRIRQQS